MAGLPVPGYGLPPLWQQQLGMNPNSGFALQLLTQLINQNQGAQNEARQANESRYQDILKLFGDNRQRTLDSLNSLSNQQVADANKSYNDQQNNLITDLANRGLSGSTKRIAVTDATKRERDAAVNRIQDTLKQNVANADLGFTDRATGVMERRSDPYPQQQNIGALVSQLAPLLGGAGGGLFGGGFNGSGAQPHYQQNPGFSQTGPSTVAPTPIGNGPSNPQALAALQTEDARRKGMIGLFNAMNKGGLEGNDATNQALQYLQQMGFANQNPAQGTPKVGFAQTSNGGGYYPPQQQQAYPQQQPQQYPQQQPTAGIYTNPQRTSPYYASRQPTTIPGPATPVTPGSGNVNQLGQLAGMFGSAISPYLGMFSSYLGI